MSQRIEAMVEELNEFALTVMTAVTANTSASGRLNTPRRWAKAWAAMLQGTHESTRNVLGSDGQGLFHEQLFGALGMNPLLVSGISARDLSPVIGETRFFYNPGPVLIGLSKVARLKRLLEERLITPQYFVEEMVAAANDPRLNPFGVCAEVWLRDVGAEILDGALTEAQVIKTRHGIGNLADKNSPDSRYASAILNGREWEHIPVAQWEVEPDIFCPPKTFSLLAETLESCLRVIVGPHSALKKGDISQTAEMWARSLLAQTAGERLDAPPKVTGGELKQVGDFTVVGRIPVHSVCEHHILHITGEVTVVIVGEKSGFDPSVVPGISWKAARQLTIQERLSDDIAHALEGQAQGVFVLSGLRHMCKEMRGVKDPIWRVHHETRLGDLAGEDGMQRVAELIPELREQNLIPLPMHRPTFL